MIIHAGNKSLFCGMTQSNKVRKAIKNGISYFSTGNQDKTHSCSSISLNLIKVRGVRGGVEVQLDPNRESFVVDTSGKRTNIRSTEFKLIQEALK